MNINLDEHQLLALDKLKTGSILCGGVGSGKSRTSLFYYFTKVGGGTLAINGEGEYSPMKKPMPLYIITTARKRDTFEWEHEFGPFILSTKLELSIGNERRPVIIDSWNNISKYVNVENAFFIFDEQRVIGYGTWVKSFIKISKNNDWILLTATPGDVWMDYVPVFIANGFYKNKTDFVRQHVVYSRYSKFPKIDHYVATGKLERLRRLIVVQMEYSRHTKAHHKYIICPYKKEDEDIVLNQRWNVFDQKPIRDIAEVCYLLRRVANMDERRLLEVKKLAAKHDKMIVFYNFNYELEMLRAIGEELQLSTAEWNGHKHQPIPKTDKWLYLVQYTAGAEGWNCVETNVIVFYSQNYSYKIMVQSAGRIDRRNTPYEDLYYYHLRSKSKIDLAINKALQDKKKFNEKLFLAEPSQEKHAL